MFFYEETEAGQFVPGNLMVDLEPNVIDDVKNWKYSIHHRTPQSCKLGAGCPSNKIPLAFLSIVFAICRFSPKC